MWIGQRQAGGSHKCGRNSRKHSRGLTPQVCEARPLSPPGFSTKEATHSTAQRGGGTPGGGRDAGGSERKRGRERDTETRDEGEKQGRKTDSAPERSEGREREVDKTPNEDRAPEGKEPGRERETERQEGNRPPGKGGQDPKKWGRGERWINNKDLL